MASDTEIWNSPSLESDYYQYIKYWEISPSKESTRLLHSLEKAVESAITKGELYEALMWLNRLEIYFPPHETRHAEFEQTLMPAFYKRFADVGKYHCRLLDYHIPKISDDIRDYKNKHHGERCFILGTGPSLDQCDLQPLKNEITFGCNLIFRNFEKMGFETTYYSVEDFFFFKRYANELGMIKDAIKFIPFFRSPLLPHTGRTVYLNHIIEPVIYNDFPFFGMDIARRIWSAANAVYLNLQLALYMGFSEVYLLGVDHRYDFPSSMGISGNDCRLNHEDINHCLNARFAPKDLFHMPVLKRSEKAYIKARFVYEVKGRRIYNCTPDTRLDVFEKIPLTQALANKKPEPARTFSRKYDISIIIPALNAETTLVGAIDSAMNQLSDCEIIIIDDGSTDGTAEVAEEYTDRFKNIRYVFQENKGLGGARNTGMNLAKGKYITFLDADDTLVGDILDKAFAKIERENADILVFDFAHMVDGKDIQPTCKYLIDKCGYNALSEFMSTHILAATARLYRLDFLRSHQMLFPEYIYHEDILFTLMAYYHAQKTTFLPLKGYNWIRRKGSITAHIGKKHIDSMSMQLDNVKDFITKEGLYDKLRTSYIVFAYRLADILLQRIRKIGDTQKFSDLALYFMDFLENHDLDTYENLIIGNSFKANFANNLVMSIFVKDEEKSSTGASDKKIPAFPD